MIFFLQGSWCEFSDMGLHFHNPLPFLHLIHFFINPFLHFCDPLKILFCRSTLWLLGTLPLVNMYQARDQPPESTKGFEQECVTGPCFSSCKVYMHKERGSGNVADQRSRQRLGLCISRMLPRKVYHCSWSRTKL